MVSKRRDDGLLPLPIIIGPTGVGKTGVAIDIAEHLPVEIVSMDSVVLYKGLDVGSAKPTPQERQRVPHHLVDVTDIMHPWSVGDYWHALTCLLPAIYQRHHIPLIVGGTMLYYHAVTHGLSELPATDQGVQSRLEREQEQSGLLWQYRQLQQIDPDIAARISAQDTQRIHRALAVYYQTGVPLSKWHSMNLPKMLSYRFYTVIIDDEISIIRQRVHTRFRAMLQQGLLEEVEQLYQRFRHLDPVPRPLFSVGYRQLWDYHAGKLSYEDAITQIPIATGQLAKRQQTWLRSWPSLLRYSASQADLKPRLSNWLSRLVAEWQVNRE